MKNNYFEDYDENIAEAEGEDEADLVVVDATHSSATIATFDWVKTMIISLTVVILLLTFVFRLVTIDGFSMMNTLEDKDRAIITTFNYKPVNGDIVAISHGGNLGKTIIKRVIATEGQTIKINYNTAEVIVDGVVIDEPYIKDPTNAGNWDFPEVVPEGYVFVMGDNRHGSTDSRFIEVGLIPANEIIGKAQVVISPISRIQYLY